MTIKGVTCGGGLDFVRKAFGSVTGKIEIHKGVSVLSNVSTSVEKWLLKGYLLKVAAKCATL